MAKKDSKPLPALSPKDVERFWSNVDKTPGHGPQGECWKWTGCQRPYGYGDFHARRRSLRANRVAYFLCTGEDPWPLNVCHTCDWPPCCNGAHLFKGTQRENIKDMRDKGRNAHGATHGWQTHPESKARGERHGNAKLTDAKVINALSLRKDGWTQRQVATHFGVSLATIKYIDAGKIWTHIPR